MEFPSCTGASSSQQSSRSATSQTGGRGHHENSLNSALAFQLYASASYRYNLPQRERNSSVTSTVSISDDSPVMSSLLRRPHGAAWNMFEMHNPNATPRTLSDILDEAILLSNEVLLENWDDTTRLSSQRKEEPQDTTGDIRQ